VPLRHTRITKDEPFLAGPCIYHGGFLQADAVGAATVEIFDDVGPNDGNFADGFRAATSEHDQHIIDEGLWMLRGLYIDLGANVDHFVVYYDVDLPGASMGPTQGT